MSLWTWVLIGLCAAGALLPLVSVILVLRPALRLRSRLNELRRSRLFTSLEAMQLQRAHLKNIAAQAAALSQRAQAAAGLIRQSAAQSGYAEMRNALGSAGVNISELVASLR